MPDPYEDLCRGQTCSTDPRRGEARLARKDLHPLYGFNPQRIQPLLQGFRRLQRQTQTTLFCCVIVGGQDRAVFVEA